MYVFDCIDLTLTVSLFLMLVWIFIGWAFLMFCLAKIMLTFILESFSKIKGGR